MSAQTLRGKPGPWLHWRSTVVPCSPVWALWQRQNNVLKSLRPLATLADPSHQRPQLKIVRTAPWLCSGPIALSKATGAKLGIPNAKVLISHTRCEGHVETDAGADAGMSTAPSIDEIVQRLDDWSQSSKLSGIACCAAIARFIRALGSENLRIDPVLARISLPRRCEGDLHSSVEQFTVKMNGTDKTRAEKGQDVFVDLPIKRATFLVSEMSHQRVTLKYKARLHYQYPEQGCSQASVSWEHGQSTTSRELPLLASVTDTVIKSLSEGMEFDTLVSTASMLAEAMLRSLKLPSSIVHLTRVIVEVSIDPSNEKGHYHPYSRAISSAFWEFEAEDASYLANVLETLTPEGIQSTRVEHLAADSGKAVVDDSRGVFIALGSNLGDRVAAIEGACRAIDESGEMRVVQTSALYETEPMYVEDQDRFLNGICEIETGLEPLQLLDRLQAIETRLGRVKTVDKGPRNVDLDIVLYKGQSFQSERLTVPHVGLMKRDFVLRPLCKSVSTDAVCFGGPDDIAGLQGIMRPRFLPPTYTPLGPGMPALRATNPLKQTQVMSILNVTPDSFSDGGSLSPTDTDGLKSAVAAQIAAGATIIDIGGQSSRPNAPDVSVEEEVARILPAIEAVKSLPQAEGIAISVDTYRAPVAEAAIKAGAHIINDISAGLLDPNMLPTIAKLGCTYIMMHMRGTPATMQSEENCSYPDGVIDSIASELVERVDAAQRAGIRRWRIILDPGIGFAKTYEQNLQVLREFSSLSKNRYELSYHPWLIGSSRKGFIGKATGVPEAKDRIWGTAATVVAAVHGGASVVRVHDVREMVQVVKMADAMYRA